MKVMVLLGSVRDSRNGERIADWVMPQLKAQEQSLACEFELVDLKDINLPIMHDPIPPVMGKPYTYEHTKNWSEKVKGYDGFIFLVAEYNRSITPGLKNAIDHLAFEWKDKPVACIGYGGSGAKSAIHHLKDVFAILSMKPVDSCVHVSDVYEAFNDDGSVKAEFLEGSVTELAKKIADACAAK